MKWEYEILDEQLVLDLSFRTVMDILQNDIKNNGLKNAMISASKNFDIAINHLRECNAINYLDKCDEAYRILLSTYTAMTHTVLKYVHNINTNCILMSGLNMVSSDKYEVSKSLQIIAKETNATTEVLLDCLVMIQKGKWKSSIDKKIKKEQKTENWAVLFATWSTADSFDKKLINQEMAICRLLNNFEKNKSIVEMFAERMNVIIRTYCRFSNKNELTVHKRMYKESTSFMAGVGETSPLLRGIGNLIFNSEQRYNAPFTYYERKGW